MQEKESKSWENGDLRFQGHCVQQLHLTTKQDWSRVRVLWEEKKKWTQEITNVCENSEQRSIHLQETEETIQRTKQMSKKNDRHQGKQSVQKENAVT